MKPTSCCVPQGLVLNAAQDQILQDHGSKHILLKSYEQLMLSSYEQLPTEGTATRWEVQLGSWCLLAVQCCMRQVWGLGCGLLIA